MIGPISVLSELASGSIDEPGTANDAIVLQRMVERAGESTERRPLLEAFLQVLGRIVPWSACEVRVRENPADTRLATIGYSSGIDEAWTRRVTEIEEEGLIAWSMAGRRPVLLPDLADPLAPGWLLVPLVAQDSQAGCAILGLAPVKGPRPAARRLEMVRLLAAQAALALDNLSHIEEVRHGYGELRSLHQVASSLGRTLDLDRLFETVCEALRERMDPKVVALGVLDSRGQPMRLLAVGADPEQCRGLLSRVSAANLTLRLERGMRSGMDLEALACKSAVGLPLVHGESGGLGALLVGDGDGSILEAPDTMEWLESMSHLLASAVDNARLYEDLLLANRKLSDLQGSLVRTGRLAGIGQMAGGIAHEINNPLQVILGRIQILQFRCQDRDDLQKDFARIEQETMRIAHIVRGMQDFARQEPGGEFVRVRLEGILESVVDFLAHRFKRHCVEVVRSGDWTISVNGDPDQLRHLLLALCLNSLQAMPQGGTLRLEIERREDTVVVEVADTGPGIAAEDFERLFDPFFSKTDGTGLGLAIGYSIAQRHGGSLHAVPGVALGARMRLSLPVSPG
ncbi:MAG: hypothetical protein IPN71_07005 [Fibrobacteres bacterium]|nr:hypothetical protein [Fibrobacterota bacterium]